MKRILLAAALVTVLAAPAVAQDAADRAAGANQAQTAKPSGDLFLRSGDGAAGTNTYLRGAPINMSGAAVRKIDPRANEAAASQVYDPEAPTKEDAAAAAYAATRAPDYSASSYNRSQKGAPAAAQQGSKIASPFPTWFGNYTPPTLAQIRKNAAAKERYYAQKDAQDAARRAQARQVQAQPKRTTAFGTTSDLKSRGQQ